MSPPTHDVWRGKKNFFLSRTFLTRFKFKRGEQFTVKKTVADQVSTH